jgi:glycosyltransferase involved in cell wall biosynthesis
LARRPIPGTAGSERGKGLAQSYPISVVIPVYNAGRDLELCLKALLENNLEEVEIIVVDDASSDGCMDHVSALLSQAGGVPPFLRMEKRSGPAAVRNEGLRKARYKFIFFLDSDVVLPPFSLDRIREALDLYSHREDVGGVLGMYSEEVPWTDALTNFKNLYTCYLYRITDTRSPFLHTAIFCVRREVLEAAGGFNTNLATAEDFHLGVALGSKGFRFIIDRKIRGVHLKKYTLAGVLKEDWRRIRDLSSIRLTPEERRFSYRAHRPTRLLSLVLPVPVALLLLGGIWIPAAFLGGLAGLLLFLIANLGFLRYCRKVKGLGFSAQAAFILFIEMAWASMVLPLSRLVPQKPAGSKPA